MQLLSFSGIGFVILVKLTALTLHLVSNKTNLIIVNNRLVRNPLLKAIFDQKSRMKKIYKKDLSKGLLVRCRIDNEISLGISIAPSMLSLKKIMSTRNIIGQLESSFAKTNVPLEKYQLEKSL